MARDYQALLQASRTLFDEFSRPEAHHQSLRALDRERSCMVFEDCSSRMQRLRLQHQDNIRRATAAFREDKNRWVAAVARLNELILLYSFRIEQLKGDVAILKAQNAEMRTTMHELEVFKRSVEAERETRARRAFLEGMRKHG